MSEARERGSVAVAVMVMVLMAALGGILVERAIAETRRQQEMQHRDRAAAVLDVAGASVLARTGNGESAGSFTESGTTDGINWVANAARTTPDRWDVVASATMPSTIATATREVAFGIVRSPANNWVIQGWVEAARPVPTTTIPPTTTTIPPIAAVTEIDYLVVGGGGAGAALTGGGGGSGGVRTNIGATPFPVGPRSYAVEIGAGGSGGSPGTYAGRANNGQPSRFDIVVADGGGGGGENSGIPGNGASGGGAGHGPSSGGTGIAGQGNNGGWGPSTAPHWGAGGGGGAGAPGGRSTNTQGGTGGSGRYSPLTGQFYAAGGGGGTYNNAPTIARGGNGGGGNGGGATAGPTNGAPNSGSGGGGQRNNSSSQGGTGGSGIVIIRYPGPPAATGGTITTLGGYTLHTFVVSGVFEPNPVVGAPGAPTSVVATPADQSVTAGWAAPSDQGTTPITSYVALAVPGSSTCTAIAPTTGCVMTGLSNGTAYTVVVRALNSVGPSGPSAPSAPATPGRAPERPLAPNVMPGRGTASVSTTPPADNGSPILDYRITTSPGGFVTTSSTPIALMSGLRDGTAYTFTVEARNAFGLSAPSPSSVPVTPGTITGVEYLVVGGGGSGAAFTGGGGGAGGFLTNVGGTPFAITTRTFTVTVGNGGSGRSGPSYTGTGLNGEPSIFDTITVIGGGGGGENSATSGRSGASGGGSGHGPSVGGAGTSGQGNNGGFGPSGPPHWGAGGGGGAGASASRSSDSAGGTGGAGRLSLITGQWYAGGGAGGTFNNGPVALGGRGGGGNGGGATAGPTNGTPNTGGGGGGQRNNDGAAGGDGGSGVIVIRYPGPPAAIGGTITTVNGYTVHTFTTVGSAAFDPDPPSGSPDPPTAVSLTAGDQQISVSWVAPVVTGAGPVTSSRATASPGGATCTAAVPMAGCNLSGLTNGTTYTVSVRAINAAGTSRASLAPLATPGRAPDAPTAPAVSPGSTAAGITFTPPANNGAAILDYEIVASPGGATLTTASTSVAMTGLTNGTAYTFRIRARNSFGSSAVSPPSAAVTPGPITGIEYLVVGGGGAGAARTGGGGGAGGLRTNVGATPFAVSSGSYGLQVGAGGVGGSPGSYVGRANNGQSSRFDSITGDGGGGGGENSGVPGNGGSGGGTGHNSSTGGSGITGQGHNGGAGPSTAPNYGAAGGGGAGNVGGRGTNTEGGTGGAGRLSLITGQWYAAGGGGGTFNNAPTIARGGIGGGGNGAAAAAGPTNGAPNTGGGGGGQRNNDSAQGGSGGLGIVIIRYPGPPAATGGIITTVNGYTVHTFATVGTASFVVP